MDNVERVGPADVPGEGLLVCAYDDDEKCEKIRIEGAITLSDLRARLDDVPKDERIVFY